VKERILLLVNILLLVIAAVVLASMQSSLWFQVFGYFPGPALWIPCLVYVALYRSTLEAVIFAYLLGFALSTMTAMPEGVMMIVCLALVLSAQVFKQRIFWPGSSYIMMVCGLAALMFNIFHWVTTFVLESQTTTPAVMDWLIEALLTPIAAPPLFPVFRWFDRITQRDSGTDVSAQVS
jgi:hypothetical protein